MKNLVIELQGVEFVNKGAELMLHAIRQRVQEAYPNAIFVMAATKKVPREKLKKYGIYIKRNSWKARLAPQFLRRKMGVVLDREIKVLLDGSGFAFGDQWGPQVANRRLAKKIGALKKEKKKVILLPQAFGPFTDAKLQEAMATIIANANLIFARESQSYGYLKKIADSENIRQAPDFTNLISGKVPGGFNADSHQVAIVPNSRMIEKKGEEGKLYIPFLLAAINKVQNLGLMPYFLIHEGEDDIAIATEVNKLLPKPLEIIINEDPLVIKGIISTAKFIICSRFHGVVSALSQGVPCISTSWSHKYEMLHKEYEYEQGIITNLSNTAALEERISQLATPDVNKTVSEALVRCSKIQKERTAEMWLTVFQVIDGK